MTQNGPNIAEPDHWPASRRMPSLDALRACAT
jgi:hypothetical protein